MKVKKFVVAWHEENESGLPVHVMGIETFDTESKARQWIDECVEEDRLRHEQLEGYKHQFLDETVDDGIVHTYGNGQHTMYNVNKVELDVPAPDEMAVKLVDELRSVFKKQLHPAAKCVEASMIVGDYEKKLKPKKKYRVDVRFTPIVCVHGIEAVSAEDAEAIVNDMIDNRTLEIKTSDVMPDLLENVESVGDAEEEEEQR